MVIKEQKREEIDNQYKWDLSSIYKSDDFWKEDYEKLKITIGNISEYKGKILSNPDSLYSFLTLYFTLNRNLEKLYMYAHLNYDSDTKCSKYQKVYGQIMDLYQKFDEITTFIEPELLQSDYDIILNYMKTNPKIKEYEVYLKAVYYYKKHVLSEKEEYIIACLSKGLDNPSKTYESLTDSDMKLGIIKDEDGNEIELSDRNYSKYISSKDRKVRKQVFDTMYNAYHSFINTIASTMSSNVDININIAKIKKYDSALSMALYDDKIYLKTYINLVDTVSTNLEVLFKYYKLRKKVLNIEELHLYDLYVDLISEQDKEYKFEEAKNIVLSALNILGDQYTNDLKRAFDEKWIDIYSNVGKRSGAYSSGSYDTNPYILLNYQDKLNDVSTLAHELGHSMHSYYSRKNNSYQTSDYKIFVAEVASTVNELLLFKYLLKNSNDKSEKLDILNRLMELFKGTIYRQTMFAEFEKMMYEDSGKGEILTPEFLSERYYELNKKYFGSEVVVDENIKYEWARIPHFYYFFYVYKYATGLSAACYIVNNILNNKEGACEKYLEFLKSGGRYYPLEELKIAGVDMNDSEVIKSALKMFDETIDEFIEIYNS